MRFSGSLSKLRLLVGVLAILGVTAAGAPAAQAATDGSCRETANVADPVSGFLTGGLSCTVTVDCPSASGCRWLFTGRGAAQLAPGGVQVAIEHSGGATAGSESGPRFCESSSLLVNASCDAGPHEVGRQVLGSVSMACSLRGRFLPVGGPLAGSFLPPAFVDATIECKGTLVDPL